MFPETAIMDFLKVVMAMSDAPILFSDLNDENDTKGLKHKFPVTVTE